MSLRKGLRDGTLRGLALAGALSLSHASVAAAQTVGARSLLITALLATSLFAVPLMAAAAALTSARTQAPRDLVAGIAYVLVGIGGSFLGVAGARLFGWTASAFYCAPEIHWRVDVAGFGGFALGLLELWFSGAVYFRHLAPRSI